MNRCASAVKTRTTLTLATTFGQKNLIQKYKDEIGGKQVDMVIDGIEVSSVGQWIGLFSNFVEAKVATKDEEEAKDQFEEPEGEFNDLVIYYRFDQGKGDAIGDLSDYGNDAQIRNY